MRKKIFCLLILTLSLCALPNTISATEKPFIETTSNTEEIPEEIKKIIERLYEIKDMDKSNLTRLERKELRREVKAIKKSVRASGNGIYISSGAIIIILLLIIIL